MPFPVTAYAVGRMEACRCCALGGAANLEYSTSLYTDFPVASGLGVSTRQGSFIPTIVPHDGVHTWPVASPPTHARAVCGGRYWPPLRVPTPRIRDVVTSPGPTPCAVIYPMPCAVMLVLIQCSLPVQSVLSPLDTPIVARVAHHCLKGRPPYRRDPTGPMPCVVIFMPPCGVTSRPQPEDPFWPYSWPLGCSRLAQRTHAECERGQGMRGRYASRSGSDLGGRRFRSTSSVWVFTGKAVHMYLQ